MGITLEKIAETLNITKPNSRVTIVGLVYYYDKNSEGEAITAYLPRTLEHRYTFTSGEQFMDSHGFEGLEDLKLI